MIMCLRRVRFKRALSLSSPRAGVGQVRAGEVYGGVDAGSLALMFRAWRQRELTIESSGSIERNEAWAELHGLRVNRVSASISEVPQQIVPPASAQAAADLLVVLSSYLESQFCRAEEQLVPAVRSSFKYLTRFPEGQDKPWLGLVISSPSLGFRLGCAAKAKPQLLDLARGGR